MDRWRAAHRDHRAVNMAGARVRRWAGRARIVGERAAATAGDAGASALRAARGARGAATLPERTWRAADVHVPDAAAALPLPAAAALRRALTGVRVPSVDAFSPLGPRPADAPAVLLLPVAGPAAGGWSVEAAAELAARRCADLETPPGTPGLHTVLVTDPASRGALIAALRTAGARLPGVVVVACPDPATAAGRARALAALGLVDAVLAPEGTRLDPALASVAARAGRAVIGPDRAGETWERLAAAGRAARLDSLTPAEAAGPPAASTPRVRVTAEPRRVVVAGHDLKFAGALMDRLRADGHEVRVDAWRGHARHDVERSRALAAWADVVHCEWSLGNLAWYSRHLDSPHRTTRLTSRLHLQEAGTAFPSRVRQDALDEWVFVAEHVRAQVLRDTRFPAARTSVVPNAVAVPPTLPDGDDGRRFVLGLVGVLPERKGLHRALDLLATLRRTEPRHTLRIRGHHPEEVGWMAQRPAAAAYYRAQLHRIETDPLLAGAVAWDPHGPDMPAWYARVGVALSVSDFESFHFTLPDGAAHGCLPAALAWAGADLLYPAAWLSPDVATMAASVRAATADARAWRSAVAQARRDVAHTYAEEDVVPALVRRILGGAAT
ncbi:hypothetical protein RB202_00490 [Micrococcus yunnanensis]|uniref:hypothetical protein n=1 Tax=Micrococcus yunnanensis TaxID=566027 RepID=UPI0030147ABD